MRIPPPDKDFVFNSLLRFNYLPMVSEFLDEVPPIYSSENFTPEVAIGLIDNCKAVKERGFDQIEYKLTRFNNITRQLHIPHPLPYAKLSKCIYENWDSLKEICDNDISQIKPKKHLDDRLVVMDEYDIPELSRIIIMKTNTLRKELNLSIGNRYKVSADISSCYPSIYTHSIPWAAVGIETAKSTRNPSLWYNQLDKHQRNVKRQETQGIPIGPASSSIISEYILYQIDKTLKDKYNYIRFVDDYKCYCKDFDTAESFLIDLEQELRKYLLNINPKKVSINELPLPHKVDWVVDLSNNNIIKGNMTSKKVSDFLDYAINLQKQNPEGNVIKYAARILDNKATNENIDIIIRYLVSISFHKPDVLPILCKLSAKYKDDTPYVDISSVIRQHIKYRRSDAMSWCLYYMNLFGQVPSEELVQKIIESKDCISIAFLLLYEEYKKHVIDFVKSLNTSSDYSMDQYWLIIHELNAEIPLLKEYRQKTGLEYLFNNGVHFIKK
jgi:hypothetical protein